MSPFFTERFGNPHSTEHAVGKAALGAVDQARARISALIGAKPEEIIFTAGATEASNIALRGARPRGRRGHIVTSAIEHSSVRETVRALAEERGYDVTEVPVNRQGIVDP